MPTQDMKGRKVTNTYNELQLKARRRQSDSKWRASMANCFETLMHVIPMSKRAHKKQSKVKLNFVRARNCVYYSTYFLLI